MTGGGTNELGKRSGTTSSDSTQSQNENPSRYFARNPNEKERKRATELLEKQKKMTATERFVQQTAHRMKLDQYRDLVKVAGDRVNMGEGQGPVNDEKIINMLADSSEDFTTISSGKEVAADAKYMVENVRLVKERVREIQNVNADRKLDSKHFAESSIAFAKKLSSETPKSSGLKRNPLLVLDDDSDDEEEENATLNRSRSRISGQDKIQRWVLFSRHFQLIKSVPALSYLKPLLANKDLKPTTMKVKKCRKEAEKTVKTAQVVLEQKEKGENMGEDPSIAKELDYIRKTFARLIKKANTDRFGYYQFIFDPDDFGRTVENMFHVSFLLRDATLSIELDDAGLPVLVNVTPEQEREIKAKVKRNRIMNHQTVLAFTHDHWRLLKERLQLERPAIKPLEMRHVRNEHELDQTIGQRPKRGRPDPSTNTEATKQSQSTVDKKPTRDELLKFSTRQDAGASPSKRVRVD